ncbi:MAG: mechanosensitive ion channel family protein [Deltaproteobacteria bacterium]|nr:mechanosensitive ion channel family protein [Candidatus Zymogenaceae bacterium]
MKKTASSLFKTAVDRFVDFSHWLQEFTDVNPDVVKKVFVTLMVILLIWFVRTVVLRIAFQWVKNIKDRYQWRKISTYISVFLGILIIGRTWFEAFQSVVTFLGLLSAGLAIALKDPLVNLAGWAFILWRRPLEVGDRIQMGEHKGDVIDIRIFQFTLLEIGNWVDADQSTGRIIHIPNGKIFTEMQANYSKGFEYIWNEIPVLLTFESDWQKAKEILKEIVDANALHLTERAERKVRQAARRFLIFYTNLTPAVYTSVKESGVLLTIRYLCAPRDRRTSEQDIWEDILRAFADHDDIDFAYPTQRFYANYLEGEKGADPAGTAAPPDTSRTGLPKKTK